MPSDTESLSSAKDRKAGPNLPSWLKVGAVAAASALAGGIAAAWFYRKTLTRLRQEEERLPENELGSSADDSGDDI